MKRKGQASTAGASHRKARAAHGVQGGSGEANRLAVAILEVLAGMRTPADAAGALGISLPRYYQLETRAIEGLVAACEPRPKGKQPSLEKRVAELQQALEQAHRESARQQALVRTAHRQLGLKAPPQDKPNGEERPRSGRRKKQPTVRALKAARVLREKVGQPAAGQVEPIAAEGNDADGHGAGGSAPGTGGPTG